MIEVKVKGYVIYCKNEFHELYDFFVPMKQYRLSMKEARKNLVPESHELIAVKRDTRTYYVDYEQLLNISEEI